MALNQRFAFIHDGLGRAETSDIHGDEASADDVLGAANAGSAAAAVDKWLASAEKTIGFLQERDPRIIGIAGDRRGSGASSFARAMVKGYQLLGRRVLLIDASRKPDAGKLPVQPKVVPVGPVEISPLVKTIDGVMQLDVRDADPSMTADASTFRSSCEAALKMFDLVIVDLQPVPAALSSADADGRASGQACDAVLLVCLTEVATKADLSARMQMCVLQGFRMVGLVLNDRGPWYGKLLGK